MCRTESNSTPSRRSAPEPMPPDTLEERLATTLYLAGEAILPDPPPEPAAHAVSADDRDAPFLAEFDWLKALIAQFRQALAEDPRRAEFLRLLPQGFGDGEILRVLFCNLFPEQKGRRKVYRGSDGKPKLTPVQIEILRDAATGLSYKEIAAKRKCSYVNVSSAVYNIFRRLNASNLQEAVATAISTGCLPLDVMDFIIEASHSAPKDYSELDSMLSHLGEIEKVADPTSWQELAAFGLMLMIACGAAVGPQTYPASLPPAPGALCRLDRLSDGSYRARQIVGPGLLRYPRGLAFAPPTAKREGFTPGHLFVAHNRPTLSGRNMQEIAEFTPEGALVRTFCGAQGNKTSLRGTHGLAFTSSGALLVTSDNALLRFTEGGRSVQWFADGCCVDVCTDGPGNVVVAHYSSRGGSIEVYTRRGKLTRAFAQQPPGTYFPALQRTGNGELAALWRDEQTCMLEFYDAQGEHLRCFRVPADSSHSFALDVEANRLYLPNRATKAVHVYALDGTLQQRLALDETFTPHAIALTPDGALWLSGVVEESA